MRRFVFRNLASILSLSMLLVACGGGHDRPYVDDKQTLYYGRYGILRFVTIESEVSLKQFAFANGLQAAEVARINSLHVNSYLYNGQIIKIPTIQHIESEVAFSPPPADEGTQYIEEARSLMNDQETGHKEEVVQHAVQSQEAHLHNQEMYAEDQNGDKARYADLERQVNENELDDAEIKSIATKTEAEVGKTSSGSAQSNFKYKTPLNSSEFIWPLHGKILTRYSKIPNKSHESINIAAAAGAKIKAIADGDVIYVGREPKVYGNLVVLKHDNGYFSAYAHSEKILVTKGTHVKQGDIIALVGSTGAVKSPQLYFSMRKGKKTIDPESELDS